jgi:hypothetical protein
LLPMFASNPSFSITAYPFENNRSNNVELFSVGEFKMRSNEASSLRRMFSSSSSVNVERHREDGKTLAVVVVTG